MHEYWTVADVMTTKVLTADPKTPFKDLAQQLADWRVSAVPVIDEDRQVLGVVSKSDLVRKEEFQVAWSSQQLRRRGDRVARAKATGTTAGELMTSPAVTIGPRASLPAAARRMADHGVTRLIVVEDDGRLSGIVTRTDLISAFLVTDDELQDRVLRRIVKYSLWDDPFAIHVSVDDGVVTLSGELERRSLAEIAVRLTRTVDGVVDVRDELRYVVDDTAFHSP